MITRLENESTLRSRKSTLRERRVDSFSKRVIIFCW